MISNRFRDIRLALRAFGSNWQYRDELPRMDGLRVAESVRRAGIRGAGYDEH